MCNRGCLVNIFQMYYKCKEQAGPLQQPKAQGSNLLIYNGSEPVGYTQLCLPPLTEVTSLGLVPELEPWFQASLTISSQYVWTSWSSSGLFPCREVMYQELVWTAGDWTTRASTLNCVQYKPDSILTDFYNDQKNYSTKSLSLPSNTLHSLNGNLISGSIGIFLKGRKVEMKMKWNDF